MSIAVETLSPTEEAAISLEQARQVAERPLYDFMLKRLDQLNSGYEGHFDLDTHILTIDAYQLGFRGTNLELVTLLKHLDQLIDTYEGRFDANEHELAKKVCQCGFRDANLKLADLL